MKLKFALISTYDPFAPVFVWHTFPPIIICSVYCPPLLPVHPQTGLDLNTANSLEVFMDHAKL